MWLDFYNRALLLFKTSTMKSVVNSNNHIIAFFQKLRWRMTKLKVIQQRYNLLDLVDLTTSPLTFILSRVGPDTFLDGYRIPDIWLIISAGYPVLTGYPANYRISGRITGYFDRKQTFITIFLRNPILCSWITNPPLYWNFL